MLATADQIFIDYRIATMAAQHPVPYGLLEDHWLGVADGKIIWIEPAPCTLPTSQTELINHPQPPSPHSLLPAQFPLADSGQLYRGSGKLLMPGLIDCHTHLIYGGDRTAEWEQRLQGMSYAAIAEQGGGIRSTVQATRAATAEALFQSVQRRLESVIAGGVTTLEIKSGYGLSLDSELKMLQVGQQLKADAPIDIELTLLAAHALPSEFEGEADGYIRHVCQQIIPAARDRCTAVDVFCETIGFSLEQSRRVLQAAQSHGLPTKIHAEQLSHQGGAVMAARLNALSVDHLEYLTPQDCRSLANYPTVATLLPGAFYFLNETQLPPVESLLENQVPIAVATDCNPGSSPLTSLTLAANMACVFFGLTPEQSIAGITRNAAKALGLADSRGTIEVGKLADFSIWDVSSPVHLIHQIAPGRCCQLFKQGRSVNIG